VFPIYACRKTQKKYLDQIRKLSNELKMVQMALLVEDRLGRSRSTKTIGVASYHKAAYLAKWFEWL
jgi:hypothetical protein